jgi:hypothetical protein
MGLTGQQPRSGVDRMWPLAQISPQAYLFGLGGWLAVISQHVSDWLEMDIDLSVWLLHGIDLSADDYLLAETLITASGATAALMFCLSVLTKRAPKSAIATLLLATGLAANQSLPSCSSDRMLPSAG